MLLRPDGDDVIAIGQPAHAWLSGQLARAWGEPFDPWEEVCLAAEQHDVGMAAWDRAPKLNPKTGLPRSFMELELDDHLEIWWRAAPLVLQQSRYAALLASMHGTALYERRNRDDARVRAFLDGQAELQARLLETLRADPRTAPFAADEIVRRNQQLVWTVGLAVARAAAGVGAARARPVAVPRGPRQPALRGTPPHRPLRRRGGDAGGAGRGAVGDARAGPRAVSHP